MEQDTIENVSQPITFSISFDFLIFLRKTKYFLTSFYATFQSGSYNLRKKNNIFFGPENMKKPPSKVAQRDTWGLRLI